MASFGDVGRLRDAVVCRGQDLHLGACDEHEGRNVAGRVATWPDTRTVGGEQTRRS